MDKHFFGQAAAEVANGKIDAALYVKSLALSDGNETRGRALYIKLRAEELSREHRNSTRNISDPEIERGAKALKQALLILPVVLLVLAIMAAVSG